MWPRQETLKVRLMPRACQASRRSRCAVISSMISVGKGNGGSASRVGRLQARMRVSNVLLVSLQRGKRRRVREWRHMPRTWREPRSSVERDGGTIRTDGECVRTIDA